MLKTVLVRVETDGSGCTLHRCLLPMRFCADELLERGILLKPTTNILRGDQCDAVYVQRIVTSKAIVAIARAKSRGAKFVWDTDDACDLVPQWSPVRYSEEDLDCYEALQGIADEKWCSTEGLQSHITADRVLPNLLDPALFQVPRKPVDPSRPIQVLWFGSSTHAGDLALLEEPVANILRQGKHKATFTFWGDAPPALLMEFAGKGVQMMRPCMLDEFYRRLMTLQPDIVLCPLADHPFNAAKSNLKWMEAALAGGCPIVSFSDAFSCVEDGVTGVVANDDNWEFKINLMLEDKSGRELIADQARSAVREDWCWDSGFRQLWLKAFTDAVT